MKPSESIKEKIKGWEGCRLTAYRCPAGVPTIGYGHTGPDVKMGQTITKAEADALFTHDIEAFAERVGRIVPPGLSQCQFDALVSLAYNIGIGGLQRSALLKRVRTNPGCGSIYNEFMRHNKARVKGELKELRGLTLRRQAEANHYFGRG